MPEPTADDVATLRERSSEWFADWLRLGLEEFLFERRGRAAFPGAERFIDQPDKNVTDDLKLIGGALGARNKDAFRKGLVRALRSLDFSKRRDLVIGAHLVALGAGLGVAGVLAVIADKAYTIPESMEGRRLYDLAFDVAAQLPDIEPNDTVRCLRYLVRLERLFRPAASGKALIAM